LQRKAHRGLRQMFVGAFLVPAPLPGWQQHDIIMRCLGKRKSQLIQ
jgi:hypothetical protein